MRRPDNVQPESSRHRGPRRLLFLVLAGSFLLAVAPGAAALGQADYTGIAPPIGNTYVGPYVGPSSALGLPAGGAGQIAAPRQSAAGAVSVTNAALGDSPSRGDQGGGRLVTGWDLVTIAALGLTAVVGFAVSAGRFRSP